MTTVVIIGAGWVRPPPSMSPRLAGPSPRAWTTSRRARPDLTRGLLPRLPSASDNECHGGRDHSRCEQCADAQQPDKHGKG
jgi:hypothetical protein